MTEKSSIFDMIGPIMIGPSSSHTAGVVRIGRMARKILGSLPIRATIWFYNSFAGTYEGHGSDKAVIAGLLEYKTDDERVKTSKEIAKEMGLVVQYKAIKSAPRFHPNTIRIQVETLEKKVDVLGVSRGGGLISIFEIDGYAANLTGQDNTLLILADDIPGSIAFITDIIAHDNCNIATLFVTRSAKNQTAKLIMELDSPIRKHSLDYLQALNWVKEIVYINEFE